MQGRVHALAVDQYRQRDGARAGELECVGRVPWRSTRLRPGGDAGLLAGEELRGAERGGARVASARHRPERREVAVDEAGIEGAAAKIVGAQEGGEEREIG